MTAKYGVRANGQALLEETAYHRVFTYCLNKGLAMNAVAAPLYLSKSVLARLRTHLARSWSRYGEVCELMAESHRRLF
jgi:hypothetical protein